jgi:hypothetical protein
MNLEITAIKSVGPVGLVCSASVSSRAKRRRNQQKASPNRHISSIPSLIALLKQRGILATAPSPSLDDFDKRIKMHTFQHQMHTRHHRRETWRLLCFQ